MLNTKMMALGHAFENATKTANKSIRDFTARLPKVRASLASPLATYSVLAMMTIAISFGGAGGAGAPDQAAVNAATAGTMPAVEIGLDRTPADSYYTNMWTPQVAPTAEAEGAPVAETVNTTEQPTDRSGERTNVPMPTNANAMQTKFFMEGVAGAQQSQRDTGVPASVTLAQAALESDWGRSDLSTEGHNYFGIKAASGPGPAGVINMNTGEVINGSSVMVNAGFKAYHNMDESFEDHGLFLKDNPRYAKCFETDDPKEFARRLQAAGYATDPQYANKLIKFMDTFNLYQYDVS